MSNSSLSTESKIKLFFKKLCKLRIKSDYKMDLSFYKDAEEKQPYSTYTASGSSKFSVVKLIAVISALLFVSSLISTLNSLKNK